jgi:ankyrin repeat protein
LIGANTTYTTDNLQTLVILAFTTTVILLCCPTFNTKDNSNMTKLIQKSSIPVLTSILLFSGVCGCSKNEAIPEKTHVPPPSPEAIAAFMDAALNGNQKAVSEALNNQIDVNIVNADGNTAIMLAAFNGHAETVDILLKAKADVNKRNPDGRTALMFASTINKPSTVELLLKNGAEVNAYDGGEQWTPLMFAAGEGHTAVVDILLAHKANPKWLDTDDDSAADFAEQRGHTELAKKLQLLTGKTK